MQQHSRLQPAFARSEASGSNFRLKVRITRREGLGKGRCDTLCISTRSPDRVSGTGRPALSWDGEGTEHVRAGINAERSANVRKICTHGASEASPSAQNFFWRCGGQKRKRRSARLASALVTASSIRSLVRSLTEYIEMREWAPAGGGRHQWRACLFTYQ